MNIVDLFSGAGGLTFGFYYMLKNGKFERNLSNNIIFANELDPMAAKAFRINFPDINMLEMNIKDLADDSIRELLCGEAVDVVIGGPPCQSFSTVGQRRFDDKAKLYSEYIRILNVIKPKMFLFENVKGILSMREIFYKEDENGKVLKKKVVSQRTGKEREVPIIDHIGEKIIDLLEKDFKDAGYSIKYKLLNAVNYGVPQNRERVFIIGIRNDLQKVWTFPELYSEKISLRDAISDLPPLKEDEKKTEYVSAPQTSYQKLMRGDNVKLTCHFCGVYGDKIRTVIRNVKQGQGKDDFNALVEQGIIDAKYFLTSGYKNTYGRLVEDVPSTTITNNMCTPSGLRCIHYSQDRALSPREGARIQSFPDSFQFCGSRTDITRQIGNAVPPLLALAVAHQIEQIMEVKHAN